MHARFVPRLTARLVAAAFITLLAAACEHLPTEPGSLASIVVTRNPDTVTVAGRRNFTATGYDANGTVVGINPTWSAAAGGTISNTGVFSAGTVPGTYANSIKATVGSLSGSATVVVQSGPAATITVTPATTTLAIAGQQQYVATVRDAGGNVVVGTPIWTAQVGVGTISATGLFSAGNVAGTYPTAITASLAGLTGTASVTITPGALATVVVTPNPAVLAIGAVQQFTATGRDINNNVIASFKPFWSVQALGGTIDTVGKFTAGTVAGIFANTIRACNTLACPVGSISGFATVTVTAGALASMTVTPNPVTVGTGAQVQFTAIGRDASGNIIPVLPVPTWSVLPGKAGGTILSGGGYRAPAAIGTGIDTVVATSGAISGSARVNVVASPLTTISVTPNPANLAVGAVQTFTATGTDANGVIVATPGLTWTVVNGGGTIDPNTGSFTAGAVIGAFPNTVKATSGAVSGFATVNVGAGPVIGPSILGTAATYGITAGASVTCAGAPASVIGDVAISPGSTISGFPPCTIVGAQNLGNPTALIAQSDLTAAFIALTTMPCTATITADLGGTTLPAGVYCTGGSVSVTGELKLTGTATDVFVIRAGSTVTTAGYVTLLGSVSPNNVYFVAGSSVTLGTPPLVPAGNRMQGSMIALTSVTLVSGENLFGRALARNGSVTLGTNTSIVVP